MHAGNAGLRYGAGGQYRACLCTDAGVRAQATRPERTPRRRLAAILYSRVVAGGVFSAVHSCVHSANEGRSGLDFVVLSKSSSTLCTLGACFGSF